MRPGKFRSSQRAVSRQNFRAEKSHVTRCTMRSALAVDAVRWSASVPSAVQPRPWLAVELRGNTRLLVNAFWNQASRSVGLSGVIATLLALMPPERRVEGINIFRNSYGSMCLI
jgi:hypothetical protein